MSNQSAKRRQKRYRDVHPVCACCDLCLLVANLRVRLTVLETKGGNKVNYGMLFPFRQTIGVSDSSI
jgi:hypothetical protein